ncbi:unnamed protein product [Effrenium voratum]|uniref:Uncharacterized protein n=1 Tax=Effrenium voratum TaxID=2562239 RepID=A0AA36HN35_9DINO|nr:unnamed protein product [Effrenium voratum]
MAVRVASLVMEGEPEGEEKQVEKDSESEASDESLPQIDEAELDGEILIEAPLEPEEAPAPRKKKKSDPAARAARRVWKRLRAERKAAKKAKRKEEARAKKRRGHGANLEDFLVRTKERLEARAAEAEAEAAALLVAPKRGASGDVHGFVQKTRERLVEQVQAERAALRARQAKAAAAAAGADLDAFRQQCEARLAQRLLAGMPQVKTGLVEAEGGTGFFRRKICIVGAGPVGLWAAMLLAQKYRWTDPSGCARLRPDAPQLVLLEARSAESHCSRTDIRIALSSSTRAMLDQQTRSRSFSSGMPVAEIEEAFLRRWRKLAGSEAKILYDTSVQDLGALEDCDCVFWAAGRRSLEDASRKALGCEVKVGDSQKVIVFQISELGPDTNAWQLASLDLSGIAQQASRSLCNLRVMLRPGFEGACACWLWVFGLPEMEEKGKALVPRATLAEACQDVACQDALLPALEALQQRLRPARITARFVDASFWSSDRAACQLQDPPVPLVLLGDALAGKPFYTGSTLNRHLWDVAHLIEEVEFAYDGQRMEVSRFSAYERRYQECVRRIPEFQRPRNFLQALPLMVRKERAEGRCCKPVLPAAVT